MSSSNNFLIENGVLKQYRGPGGDVAIPDGVKKIDLYAFSSCSSLTSVKLPESVRRIHVNAFEDCKNLTRVTIPEGVKSIGYWAFRNCESLESLTLPKSLEKMAFGAFEGCTKLQEVTIPGGVDRIGDGAFSGCSALKKVTIEKGVTAIGRGAFSGCTALADIAIPDSVVQIEDTAFRGCDGLSDAQGLVIVRSVLYGCAQDKTGEVVIPEQVTRIGDSAFSGCGGLKNVTIPASVTSIGDWSFYGCANLLKLDVPASVTQIGEGAFHGCQSIESVVIPESVMGIRDKAFFGCTGLKRIELPDALAAKTSSIFDWEEVLFDWLQGKVSVNAPMEKALAAVGKKNSAAVKDKIIEAGDAAAMERFLSLWKKVKLDDLDGYIETATEKGKTEMTAMLLSYKEKTYPPKRQEAIRQTEADKELGVRKRSAADWRKIFTLREEEDGLVIAKYKGKETTVVVPAMIGNKPVVAIARWEAFRDPAMHGEIIISEGVQAIGFYAFAGAAGLKSIHIPGSIKKIDSEAFGYRTQPLDVYIAEGTRGIDSYAFSHSLATIHAPAGSYAARYAKRNKIPFEPI